MPDVDRASATACPIPEETLAWLNKFWMISQFTWSRTCYEGAARETLGDLGHGRGVKPLSMIEIEDRKSVLSAICSILQLTYEVHDTWCGCRRGCGVLAEQWMSETNLWRKLAPHVAGLQALSTTSFKTSQRHGVKSFPKYIWGCKWANQSQLEISTFLWINSK